MVELFVLKHQALSLGKLQEEERLLLPRRHRHLKSTRHNHRYLHLLRAQTQVPNTHPLQPDARLETEACLILLFMLAAF